MGKNLLTLSFIAATLVLGGCSKSAPAVSSGEEAVAPMPEDISAPAAETTVSSQVTGTIKTCTYTLGESECGKCYCLEADGQSGCEIIDTSVVGDLAERVGESLFFKVTRDAKQLKSDKNCPRTVQLLELNVVPIE